MKIVILMDPQIVGGADGDSDTDTGDIFQVLSQLAGFPSTLPDPVVDQVSRVIGDPVISIQQVENIAPDAQNVTLEVRLSGVEPEAFGDTFTGLSGLQITFETEFLSIQSSSQTNPNSPDVDFSASLAPTGGLLGTQENVQDDAGTIRIAGASNGSVVTLDGTTDVLLGTLTFDVVGTPPVGEIIDVQIS